jgi:hypothetical protein
MSDPWGAVGPSVDWIFGIFEAPVKRLPSARGTVALSVAHVGGPAMRRELWACLAHEVERETGGRYVVYPIGLTTDDAQLLIVAKGERP